MSPREDDARPAAVAGRAGEDDVYVGPARALATLGRVHASDAWNQHYERVAAMWVASPSFRAAIDAARAPLLADLAEARQMIELLESYRQLHRQASDGYHQGAVKLIEENKQLRQHILDIDAHATPYGDLPDEPGYVGMYLVTAGALHRALGKIGHTAPKCKAEAELAALRADYRAAEAAGNAQLARLSEERGVALVEVTRLTALLAQAETERDEARAEHTWVNATRRADALTEANETLAAQVERLLRDRDEARATPPLIVPLLRLASAALAGAPNRCRYHGDDFGRLGWERGEPRCDSCKQPWRVERALAAIERAIIGPVEAVDGDGSGTDE